jgi:hypothetical protein
MAKKRPPKNVDSQIVGTIENGTVKRRPGQPTMYNLELAEEICARIAQGELAIAITREEGMPSFQTLMNWCMRHPEFFEMYAKAKSMQADRFAEQCLELSDETRDSDHAQVQRLRVDTRKWYTAKVRPRMWGDGGTGLEPGKGNSTSYTQRIRDRIAEVQRRRAEKSDKDSSEE